MALRRLTLLVGVALATQGRDAAAQRPAAAGVDSLRRDQIIPPGLGSLRREDVALSVQVQGLTVRAIPLDESVTRALAPDLYNSYHSIRESRSAAIERVRTRLGLPSVQAWHVSFFNQQPGEARYDPRGMLIRSAGRDFRPLDVIALTPGYDDGRLAQSRTVAAIFVFDPAIQLSQPMVVTLSGVQTEAWTSEGGDGILQKLDRERASIWSRAGAARKPPTQPLTGTTPWQ